MVKPTPLDFGTWGVEMQPSRPHFETDLAYHFPVVDSAGYIAVQRWMWLAGLAGLVGLHSYSASPFRPALVK